MKTQKLIKKGTAGRPDLTYTRKSPYGDGGFAIYGVRGVTRGDSYLNVYYDQEGNFIKATRTSGGKARPVSTGAMPIFFEELGKMELANPLESSGGEDPLDAMYVEYLRPMQDEEPFMMGGTKYEFVRARYPDGRIDIGVYSTAGDLTYGYRHWRQMMNLDRTMQNPKGVYTTYSAWRAAAKKAGAVRFEGDKDIAQAFDATGFGVAEWDGAEGYIYRKSMNNPRQRIAVSLSKSRKRNPLESGANISDDQDINVQASNMG